MILYMYISPGQGLTTHWGRNFDVNRNFLSLRSLFYVFPKQKHKWPNLTLPYNRSRLTQRHYLNKLGSTRVQDAAYQDSRSSAFWFQRRRFFKVLLFMGMVAISVMWPGPFQDRLNILSYPHPMGTQYEISIQSAQWFLRRRCSKSVDRQTTDDGGLPIL